jgi:hypothetical protein
MGRILAAKTLQDTLHLSVLVHLERQIKVVAVRDISVSEGFALVPDFDGVMRLRSGQVEPSESLRVRLGPNLFGLAPSFPSLAPAGGAVDPSARIFHVCLASVKRPKKNVKEMKGLNKDNPLSDTYCNVFSSVRRDAEKKYCNLVIAYRTAGLSATIGEAEAGNVLCDLPVLVPLSDIAKGEELCAYADPWHFVLPEVKKTKAFGGVKKAKR